MKPSKFLESRLRTQLKFNGVEYSFNEYEEDEYHQMKPTEKTVSLTGLYHESNSFITEQTSDGSVTRSKKSPMILCLLKDAKNIKRGYTVEISGGTYKVVGYTDVQNYGVVADISLEMVDHG